MRKLELNSMYPKLKSLVLFVLVLSACSTQKKGVNPQLYTDFCNVRSINSLHFPKAILRINTDGFLRTHKASVTYLSDSIISINIFSSVNRHLANLIFDSEGLKFYEKYSGVGYSYPYQYLSKSITYPVNYDFVRDVLFGFCPKVSSHSESNFDNTFIEFNKQNDLSYSLFIHRNEGDVPILVEIESSKPVFKLVLGTISEHTLNIPEFLTLALNFNGKLLEFEIEYIFEKLIVNKEVAIDFDNSFPLKIVNE